MRSAWRWASRFAAVLKRARFRGQPVPFVMELPNYRLPAAKSVARLVWDKAKGFVKKAFTVVLAACVLIWFLQTFDARLNVVDDVDASLLAGIGGLIAPLFAPLGFGDWRAANGPHDGLHGEGERGIHVDSRSGARAWT